MIRAPFRQHVTVSRIPHRATSCVHTEYTLHQLSPYIGKLKSSSARWLVENFSRPGDLVVDPFSGAGTIPLEAVAAGRRIFASDKSQYSQTLTTGKLSAPLSLEEGLDLAAKAIDKARVIRPPHLNKIPFWIRRFFHPQTLKEAVAFAQFCRGQDHFLMSCLLGILHHQRPGFLSYPSSHLVPYLRNRNFPRSEFPTLYRYRPLEPRLKAKISRALKRTPADLPRSRWAFQKVAIERAVFPRRFDAVITSPPYMNALDYIRDNRLRLWFLRPDSKLLRNNSQGSEDVGFHRIMRALLARVEAGLKTKGYCVLVVGDRVSNARARPAQVVETMARLQFPALRLVQTFEDRIPDIRRARRDCRGVKREKILVFQKI